MTKNSLLDRDATIPQNKAESELGISLVEDPRAHSYGFAIAEIVYRAHFQKHHAVANCSYNDYRPIYRYGYDLGTDDRYQHADWTAVEQVAQVPWEVRNPGTWAEFHDTIQFAWEIAQVV